MWAIKMLVITSLTSVLITINSSCRSDNVSLSDHDSTAGGFISEEVALVGNNVGEAAPYFQLRTTNGTLTSNEIASNTRPTVLFFAASY
mgnify:FL=1